MGRTVFMKKTLLKIIVLFIIALPILTSCASKVGEAEEAKVKEAFNSAYTVAEYFSAYAKNVYEDASIEISYDNEYISALQYDRFAPCGTMAELDAMLDTYFTPEICDILKASEVYGGAPVFLEKDGALYRCSDFLPGYPISEENIEVISVKATGKGIYTVSVKAEYPNFYGEELLTVTHDYTCEEVEQGVYKFTGEFPMLADIAIDEIKLYERLLPLG